MSSESDNLVKSYYYNLKKDDKYDLNPDKSDMLIGFRIQLWYGGETNIKRFLRNIKSITFKHGYQQEDLKEGIYEKCVKEKLLLANNTWIDLSRLFIKEGYTYTDNDLSLTITFKEIEESMLHVYYMKN